jgi:predicted amino acid racemase
MTPKFKIINNILKVYSSKESLEELLDFKKEIEQSIGKNIKYLLYTNCIGYHSGYDCDTQEHIYIGDLSESRSIKKLQNGKN